MVQRSWLLKSEPASYSWDDLERDREALWDGVRNHRAANNLRAMREGDRAFFYHSGADRQIVGLAEIVAGDLADPKDAEGRWAAARIRPVRRLARPVSLATIRADDRLADIELVRLPRLSVVELAPAEWAAICDIAAI